MSWSPPDDPKMSDAEFRSFQELVRAHCGLHFDAGMRFLLENRVLRRMRELEITNFAGYHYELRCGSTRDGEIANLVDDLATNETFFFREIGQLRSLIDEILPEALAARREAGGGPVRIWSAGCASGEEPYSIVMMAKEAGFDTQTQLRVVASDVSRRALRAARQGDYRASSFRETESTLRDRYFHEKDGYWSLDDDVRKCVDFVHLNLVERSRVALFGPMDVILCRNVIIYFDRDGKREVVGILEDKLRPGGHLLLGHSESLLSLSTTLELRHLSQAMVYRRPRLGLGRSQWEVAAEAAIANPEEES